MQTVELAPRSGVNQSGYQSWQNRPDWDENSQPPDPKTGVIAHTKDPTKYGYSGGAVVIPRASGDRTSSGFNVDDEMLVYVDPPIDSLGPGGYKGVPVVLGKTDGAKVKKLRKELNNDPSEVLIRVAQEQAMPAPQRVEMTDTVSRSEALATTFGAGAIPAGVASPPEQGALLELLARLVQQQQPPALPAALQPIPTYPAVDWQTMFQAQQEELRNLRELVSPAAKSVSGKAEETPKQAEPEATERHATSEEIELPFLTTPPSAPQVLVTFDLGRYGGKHLKRYHHASLSGPFLQLVYDTRFPGDQFIPPETGEGDDPITLTFPKKGGRTIKAVVLPDAHRTIGCMDLFSFLIEEDNQPGHDI